MSEVYKSAAEWEADEREERVVAYEDGGSSAIIVDKPGEVVDFYEDNHKYLKLPVPVGNLLITGHTEAGEEVKMVINCDYSVAFGKDADGKQFAEVSQTTDENLADLEEPMTIGKESPAFSGLIVDSVGAEYKAFGYGAEGKPEGQNPFSIAERLIERAKKVRAARQ